MLARVLGRPVDPGDLVPALLDGHRRLRAAGASYPVLAPVPGEATAGLLLDGATRRDIAGLNHFEAGEYRAALLPVRALSGGGGRRRAWLLLPLEALPATGEAWGHEARRRKHKTGVLAACDGWMAGWATCGQAPPPALPLVNVPSMSRTDDRSDAGTVPPPPGGELIVDEKELGLRRAIVEACRRTDATGLNQGTSGNISARHGDAMLITPTGTPYDEMTPGDVARMPLEGEYGSWEGPLAPSSEWRFHLDIMRAKPEVGAIVHSHPTYATALAMARKDIPAAHYMVAASGGPSIRCGGYATYGTKELSEAALKALDGRTCCLLANHGMIATGADLGKAMWLAAEVETIARQYLLTLTIGGPVLLDDAEIERVKEKFRSYGPRPKGASAANDDAQGLATAAGAAEGGGKRKRKGK